jgi:hypothetical protein
MVLSPPPGRIEPGGGRGEPPGVDGLMGTLRRLALICAAVVQAGCGLPDTYFLQAPTVVTLATGTSNFFLFANPVHDLNHDINVNFTGNELYYKFYADFTAIDQNAYSSSSSSDASVQLTAKGFLALRLATDTPISHSVPQVPIGTSLAQAGSTVTVTINGTVPGLQSTYVVSSGPSGEVRRNVLDPVTLLNSYKTFLNNTNSTGNYTPGPGGDADVSAIPVGTTQVYVAMYALSFGYTGTSTPQRSVPTYLGYVAITSFP